MDWLMLIPITLAAAGLIYLFGMPEQTPATEILQEPEDVPMIAAVHAVSAPSAGE